MNLILLYESDFAGHDAVRLSGRRVRHIRKVLRAHPGDTLRVGLLGGYAGTGRLESLDRDHAELTVELDEPPPAASRHRLALALPRPPALRRILRAVTSLGVKRITLIGSTRVERSFWQSSQLRPDRIREQLELGLEQARDTILPEVDLEPRFSRFVSERLEPSLAGARGLVGDPLGRDLRTSPIAEPCLVVVGPEGGFVDSELAALEQRGVERVSLGCRPLTVDTAVVALLALLG